MSETPSVKVSNDHGEAALIWVIWLSIVLFSGDPDLHDLILRFVEKLGAP